MQKIPKALTIAGSDSGGGAGIQADLKTFASLGVHGSGAIVALTAQNTKTVTAVHNVPTDFISKQIDAIFDDIGADAVKIGMLSTPEIINTVAASLKKWNAKNIVLDPVIVAASGAKLLQDDAIDTLKKELIPSSSIITPNLYEAEILTNNKIKDIEDMKIVAKEILKLGCKSVLIKGGHLNLDNDIVTDIFYDGTNFTEIKNKRIDKECHGTGCALSSAIAANLAKNPDLKEAVKEAISYVHKALEQGYKIGEANFVLNHFYKK
ncbi:bifunctional hydroxymethylpyrimidine kinase/phosphomethylpyrimidine kinase [Candidatus Woesearchaeota archaeon]|nr:bifunctional hydroxymethylpyrimidine kinase/phosphomethylpyrimidine kinase [Candidatus Woesearchaeota archaeon]|tara:strand:+ start:688 stop:1482 length:795 start_codon:yes stop_codon:yes gene_type:complete